MDKNPGFVQPDTDLRLNKPEIFMEVDRQRAADAGVAVDQVARTVETMLGGRQVTRYKRDAEQYDVVVQTVARGRATPEDIDKLFVRGRGDAMVPLGSLVKVREAVSPRELNHFNQRRSVSITANLAPNYALGEALQFMDADRAANVLQARLLDRAERRLARIPRVQRRARPGVRAGAAVHLPRAVRAVRELRRSVRDPAVGAAVDGRRAARVEAGRRHA